MFKSLAAIMLVATSSASELLLSTSQRHARALGSIYDALSYV